MRRTIRGNARTGWACSPAAGPARSQLCGMISQRARPMPTKPASPGLRRPETGMVMVRGRAGAIGDPFNLGEMTVTPRLPAPALRHDRPMAMCRGATARKRVLRQWSDALMAGPLAARVDAAILKPLAAAEAQTRSARASQAASDAGRLLHHGAGRMTMDATALSGGFAQPAIRRGTCLPRRATGHGAPGADYADYRREPAARPLPGGGFSAPDARG